MHMVPTVEAAALGNCPNWSLSVKFPTFQEAKVAWCMHVMVIEHSLLPSRRSYS